MLNALSEALLLNPDPKQYVWVCQGVTVVDNMSDGDELLLTDVSQHVYFHKQMLI